MEVEDRDLVKESIYVRNRRTEELVLDRPTTISPAGAAPDPDGHLAIDLVLHLCGGAVVHDKCEDGTGTEPERQGTGE